jgi:hypothetical protein
MERVPPTGPQARAACRQPVILDGRSIHDPQQMTNLGFIYHSIGGYTVVAARRVACHDGSPARQTIPPSVPTRLRLPESFWESGGRAYEDQSGKRWHCAACSHPAAAYCWNWAPAPVAARRAISISGTMVLLDYSLTSYSRLQAPGTGRALHIYVAADVYRLPFASGLFDAACRSASPPHGRCAAGAAPGAPPILQPAVSSSWVCQQAQPKPSCATCCGASREPLLAGTGRVRGAQF